MKVSNVTKKQIYTTGFGAPVEMTKTAKLQAALALCHCRIPTCWRNSAILTASVYPNMWCTPRGRAHGYFEVTADVTKYTKAKFLSEIGKRTDLFVRFSTVGGEKGSADAERDTRGFRIQLRQTAIFYKADLKYGSRVAEGLGLDTKEVKRLAEMSQEDRAKKPPGKGHDQERG